MSGAPRAVERPTAPRRTVPVQLKIVSAVVLVLALGGVVSLGFNVDTQRRGLLEAAEQSLAVNTAILNVTVRNLMLAGEAPVAVRTMQNLQGIGQFEEVAIFRVDGSIAFNDYQTLDFVNEFQDRIRFERTPRVERTVEDDTSFRRVLATNAPVRAEDVPARRLRYYFPILNTVECRGCHGATPFIRGVAQFTVSTEPIYDRIDAARALSATIAGVAALAAAGLLILALQRVIVSPVLAIGRAVRRVGSGDLDTRVGVRSRDELGALAGTLNEMIAGLRERNELALRNRLIEERNRESRKYLDTIQEGLLLIDRDLVIGAQYSSYLERLFATDRVAGLPIVAFLYPDASGQRAEREELAQFLGILFTNTTSDMEMILSINPLSDRTLRLARGASVREIVVNAGFHRIMDGERVGNVMVIFEDRTDLVKAQRDLAEERARGQAEIEHVAALLRAGPAAVADFIAQAREALGVLESFGARPDAAAVPGLFRSLHSLKGAARALSFATLAQSAHRAEDVVAAFRDGKRAADSELTADLGAAAEQVGAAIVDLVALEERFRRFSGGAAGAAARGAFGSLVGTLEDVAGDIARSLGREVKLAVAGAIASEELVAKLRDPLIHLVRNAIDHGIEEPYERLAAGKPAAGTISLSVESTPGRLVVRVADDGRGIDWEAVRKRAVALGLIPNRPAGGRELLPLLFSQKFSSKDQVTEISGRGVGLDVVAAALHALGGSIGVATVVGKGTTFSLRIPV